MIIIIIIIKYNNDHNNNTNNNKDNKGPPRTMPCPGVASFQTGSGQTGVVSYYYDYYKCTILIIL